ncbi:MAG: hypothetical protein ACFFA8_15535 [Promethearchaeota archaeon]
MKKKGWAPYSFKFKYIIPLIIYFLVVSLLLAYEWSHEIPSIVTVIGATTLLITFFINYIVGVRRVFSNIFVKYNLYNLVYLIGWVVGSAVMVLLQAIFLPEIMDTTSIIASIFLLGFGSIIYLIGMNKVIKNIKDISI